MPAVDEEEFRKAIHQKYIGSFQHCARLHNHAQSSLADFNAFISDSYQAALSLILGRAFKSFSAVYRLCEIAFCEDAGVILRSLLNLLAITRWTSAQPEPRARKYLGWYWVQMEEDARKFSDRISKERIAEIDEHYKKIKHLFEYTDKKGKRRVADAWYKPEANTIRQLFEEVDLLEQYEEGYSVLSGVEHSDATAYFAMLVESEKGPGRRQIDIHSDLFVPHYLRNAFQYFADIFSICGQELKIGHVSEFEEIRREGMEYFRKVQEEAARNASS